MTVRRFLERLEASDIRVWAEGDRLRCNAPQGLLTPELRDEVARRKMEILEFLRAGSISRSSLVPIQPKGSRPPFFAIPGHNGDVFCFVRLAHHMGEDQPFYGLQPPGYEGDRAPLDKVTDLAAHYVNELRRFLPGGPYLLGGYCAGGTVAFEVARQLRAKGEEVGLLSLFGTPFPTVFLLHNRILVTCQYLFHRIPYHLRAAGSRNLGEKLRYFRDRTMGFTREAVARGRETAVPDDRSRVKENVARLTLAAVQAYRPADYPGRIHFFAASALSMKRDYGFQRRWRNVAGDGLDLHVGPDGCTGDTMLREPWAGFFAERLQECLDRRRGDGTRRIFDGSARDKSARAGS